MYKYILLDWDGNVAKTLDVWLNAVRLVMEKRGIHKTDQEVAHSFGVFRSAWKTWGVTDIDEAMQEADTHAKQHLPDVELYPGALEVISELHKRGKHLALITSSLRENVEHLLEKHGLLDFFEVIIAAEDVTHVKPHPESLEKALAALGGTKDDAVIVGDSDKDIGAAKNMGIDSILFHSSEHHKFYDFEKLKKDKPTHIVADFSELLKIV